VVQTGPAKRAAKHSGFTGSGESCGDQIKELTIFGGDIMKKGILVLLIALAAAGLAFAQSYTVESITGSVQRESGNARVDIKVGETLNADTVIYTAAASSLVLKSDERNITIPAARSGKVSELAAAGSGLRISGTITHVDTEAAVRTGAQVSTASARGEIVVPDNDIAAE